MRQLIIYSLVGCLMVASGTTASPFQLLREDESIEGTKCEAGAVQAANDGQLYSILSELVKTPFFRLFRVNVKDHSESDLCAAFQKQKMTGKDEKRESDDQCGDTPSNNPFSSVGNPLLSPKKKPTSLCSLDSSSEDPFGGTLKSSTARPFEQVDKRISFEESAITKDDFEDDCGGEDSAGDFWLDICEGTSSPQPEVSSSESDYINLQLNQERNTGYQGAHIWEAIYAENCHRLGEEGVCLEQDVLSRLIGGLHSSVSVAVAKHYYPPGAGGSTAWRSNPSSFMERVGNHPDRVKNLHFSFIVLLRALFKAKPILQEMEFHPPSNPNPDLDHSTRLLVHHLLEASVVKSCGVILDSFDESAMFSKKPENLQNHEVRQENLAKKFKAVFRNITSLIDCVTCQRCRLHAKVSILGVGAALKILLTPSIAKVKARLGREEVVALVNTVQKLSEAIRLTNQLAASSRAEDEKLLHVSEFSLPSSEHRRRVEKALALSAELSRTGKISSTQEATLVDIILKDRHTSLLDRDDLLALASHFGHSVNVFGSHVERLLFSTPPRSSSSQYDAIVIGGGLAGMVAALSVLDRGGRVLLLEKQGFLGGNSAKASSGVNAINTEALQDQNVDSFHLFLRDTLQSAEGAGRETLASILVNRSVETVEWLSRRSGLTLPEVSQLGGHSRKRTWRPEKGMIGAELTMALGKTLREEYEGKGLDLVFNAELVSLLHSTSEDGVKTVGVEFNVSGLLEQRLSPSVILATGGFGYDVPGLLQRFRPDLTHMPTTLGEHTTGDGIKIAVRDVKAKLVDMAEVQLHPTGFVDPKEPEKQVKVLAAEMLRGIGGIIIDPSNNERFVNELGTRAFVTEKMLQRSKDANAKSSTDFWILLNDRCVQKGNAERHVKLYALKGLLKKVVGLEELAELMNTGDTHSTASSQLQATLMRYSEAMTSSAPDFTGKKTFFGEASWYTPPLNEKEDDTVWWLGKVTPVIHYTMGGLAINERSQVLLDHNGSSEKVIEGLYAVGEVSGGVHGKNRLGGNSLLECAVFGRLVGQQVSVMERQNGSRSEKLQESSVVSESSSLREFTSLADMMTAASLENKVLVALYGDVYDLTTYYPEHPGGKQAILDVSGKDGTEIFATVHTRSLLNDMGFTPMGKLLSG